MAGPVLVKIKRLPHGQGLPLPTRMTASSAGMDLPAAIDAAVTIAPGDIRLIPCGFAMAIPHGYEGQVRPRSGLSSRHGVTLINTPGTIDADYRGEIHVPLINLGKQPFTVDRGTRVAQLLITPVPDVVVEEVDELDATGRGSGGFGSTGS